MAISAGRTPLIAINPNAARVAILLAAEYEPADSISRNIPIIRISVCLIISWKLAIANNGSDALNHEKLSYVGFTLVFPSELLIKNKATAKQTIVAPKSMNIANLALMFSKKRTDKAIAKTIMIGRNISLGNDASIGLLKPLRIDTARSNKLLKGKMATITIRVSLKFLSIDSENMPTPIAKNIETTTEARKVSCTAWRIKPFTRDHWDNASCSEIKR